MSKPAIIIIVILAACIIFYFATSASSKPVVSTETKSGISNLNLGNLFSQIKSFGGSNATKDSAANAGQTSSDSWGDEDEYNDSWAA